MRASRAEDGGGVAIDTTSLQNPFRVWAELTGELRDRFVSQLGEERPFSPYTGAVLGQLAGMITRCEHLGISLQQLHEHDPKAFEAFLRALETS